ncbi:MAG: hypothetical protein J6Z17_04340 [Treponema sp.]|nr:hypothetical protein [Treponema sp.]
MSNVIDRAKKELKKRRFSRAIKMLESRSEFYPDDFEYFVTLGKACLYVGDFGSAASYYGRAREIKINNTELLLGQAAIYLCRGDTERAVDYYLDILENEPGNPTAKAALEFIKTHADYSSICRWNDSGKIQRFFPPLGLNPLIIQHFTLAGLLLGAVASFLIIFSPLKKEYGTGARENISSLALSDSEISSPKLVDLSGTKISVIMTPSEIVNSFNLAQKYFQEYKDNFAQIEINRILNSDASLSIKQKSVRLAEKLNRGITFDRLLDSGTNLDYETVRTDDFFLYEDCVVSWRGRFANARTYDDGSFSCDFLLGYEDSSSVKEMIPIKFSGEIYRPLDGEKNVQFLAKLHFDSEGKLSLEGLGSWQPVGGKF